MLHCLAAKMPSYFALDHQRTIENMRATMEEVKKTKAEYERLRRFFISDKNKARIAYLRLCSMQIDLENTLEEMEICLYQKLDSVYSG